MQMTPVQRLSALGKLCLGFIVTVCGLVQVPAVNKVLVPLAAKYPHVSMLLGSLTVIGSFLANPQVQQVLGIQEMKAAVIDADGSKTEIETKTTTVASGQ